MNYLKERYKIILIILLIYIIFMVSFYLYNLPLESVIYPLLLSLFLIAVIALFDFIRLKKKHDKLKNGILIKPDSIIENDYQKIIEPLEEEKQQNILYEQNRYQEMIDYYTTWVHQIKTPIASMRLTLENEDSEFSRKIRNNLTSIENYVDMVLAYLRLDSSSNDLVIKEVNLDNVIKECIKHYSSDFIARKLKVEIVNCENVVLSDEKWLSFIIEQLLSNALKYTSTGKITISYIDNSLHIKDTGIGIDEKDLPRIFEKGYTGFNGRLNQKSSGLGLYLVKRSIEMLNHKIRIESKPNQGTDVIITFNENNLKKD
ncbi:MAG: sensor histidine kinase [Erysipelotrichaceae bacterium]